MNLEELKIIMVAPRGIGKTSLLAAMHDEFDKTFERANLQTWVDDSKTLRAIQECKNILRKIDPRLSRQVTPTDPQDDPWSDQGFMFQIGSAGKKFIQLRFTDPSGEYFNPDATHQQKEYVKRQLNECDAVVIPIDATALMQNRRGKVGSGETGIWHDDKNNPDRITELIKDAYTNVTRPRLVILAPIKCETYMRNGSDAEDLFEHVKLGYRQLFNFLKSPKLSELVAVVVTPVQTIGNVVFAYHKTDQYGLTRFYYHKTPLNAPYKPKDGEQPLRYILLFLINVYLDNKKKILEQEQELLKLAEQKLKNDQASLYQAQQRYQEAETRFNDRKKTWFLFRAVLNLFDDRATAYQEATVQYEERGSILENTQTQVELSSLQVAATEAEIKIFNNALFRFAKDCKNNDGFAIIQGHHWLNAFESGF